MQRLELCSLQTQSNLNTGLSSKGANPNLTLSYPATHSAILLDRCIRIWQLEDGTGSITASGSARCSKHCSTIRALPFEASSKRFPSIIEECCNLKVRLVACSPFTFQKRLKTTLDSCWLEAQQRASSTRAFAVWKGFSKGTSIFWNWHGFLKLSSSSFNDSSMPQQERVI